MSFSTKLLTLQRNCKHKQCFICHALSYSRLRAKLETKICQVAKGLTKLLSQSFNIVFTVAFITIFTRLLLPLWHRQCFHLQQHLHSQHQVRWVGPRQPPLHRQHVITKVVPRSNCQHVPHRSSGERAQSSLLLVEFQLDPPVCLERISYVIISSMSAWLDISLCLTLVM